MTIGSRNYSASRYELNGETLWSFKVDGLTRDELTLLENTLKELMGDEDNDTVETS